MSAYAEGGNYQIQLLDGMASCRVWKRPDVDSQQGAKWADEMRGHLARLVAGPRKNAHALLLDLALAPPVAGPVTTRTLAAILGSWEVARRRVAVIVGDHPLQSMQIRRLVKERAPSWGRVCDALDQALTWLHTV